jgi:hypothetical protein
MDLMNAVSALPGIGPALPYIAFGVAVCAALATRLKPPAAPGWYSILYGLVNFVALNFGHAKNATALAILGIDATKTGVLGALVGLALALNACTAPTPPVVLSDMATAVDGLAAVLPSIVAADPSLAPKLQPLIDQLPAVQANLKTLQASVAPDAGTLAQIDAWLNGTVKVAASIPAIPAPYDQMLQAASVLLPVIEAEINPVITRATGLSAVGPSAMSADEARAILLRAGR